jgi:NTE family protein
MTQLPVYKSALLLLTLTLTYQTYINAQQSTANDMDEGLKVGLVLSGGGAKGIAHIGVLEVLEEAGIQVDYISGTSMGSIIGALYSIGYSTDEMKQLTRTTDWEELFAEQPGRRFLSMHEKKVDDRFIISFPLTDRGINLPSGLIAGQNIFLWLSRYTWPVLQINDFSKLPIPYATVATNLETGEAVIFKEGYLPDVIRASISFPSAMMPYEIDGNPLVDGGLARNLPVQEVLDMGADYVIAVDVSTPLRSTEELNSIASILTQAVNYRVIEKINEQKMLADLNIEVRDLDEYQVTDFNMANEFIEIGRKTAARNFEELQQIAVRQQEYPRTQANSTPEIRDEIYIEIVSVTGNENVPGDVIRVEVDPLQGRFVRSDDIENVINQLYGSRLFNLITYRIHELDDNRYHLEVRVIENIDDSFRFSARYESQTQASLLLHTSFRNLLQRGSTLRMSLRLGRDTEFLTDYLTVGSSYSRIGLNTKFRYKREQIDYYNGPDRTASLTSHMIRGDLFAGTFMNKNSLMGIGLRGDINYFSDAINPDGIPFSQTNHHAVYGKFIIDTYNRRSFPNRGQYLLIHGTFSDEIIFSPLNFNEQHFYWNQLYGLNDTFTLNHTLYLGRSFGEELPWDYWFSLNKRDDNIGMIRFGGYERYELSGRNTQMASVGVQYEFIRHRFLKFNAYFGNTFDNWNWDIRENSYRSGFSISAGILTVLGPLEFIVSTSSRNSFLYEIQIGYDF